MKNLALAVASSLVALSLISIPAYAAKSCDELKSEIATKLDAKGVSGYTLDAVANDQVGDQTVVGSCEGGTQKITYVRGGATATAPAADTAAAPAQ
jgi:hypothetical protein